MCLLGASNRISKRSPYETVYQFKYYFRDRGHVGTSMFQLAAFDVTLAEIVKASQGSVPPLPRHIPVCARAHPPGLVSLSPLLPNPL